jgi:hypothetical protein
MRTLRVVGLFLAGFLLMFVAQAGAAKSPPSAMRTTGHSIWTLAMDWPRVAYASGKGGSDESIHVWNVVTGATSVIKTGFATHHAAELAIAGNRVAWIRSVQLGNTELDHWLYTARPGGRGHLLSRMFGYTGTDCGLGGPQMGGLVGSAGVLAFSAWKESQDGSTSSSQRLDLITPKGLRTIATGPDAIVSESADDGHIAALPLPTPSLTPDACDMTLPASVAVYSTSGALLSTVELPSPDPSTLGYQVALSGHELVVLTYGLHEPNGPAWVTLTVFDWTTGTMLHTWPVGITHYPGEVDFTVHGELAVVHGPSRLHLVDLNTGRDVTISVGNQALSPTSLGARGLVYAVNAHERGKLVFVPWAKLLAFAS